MEDGNGALIFNWTTVRRTSEVGFYKDNRKYVISIEVVRNGREYVWALGLAPDADRGTVLVTLSDTAPKIETAEKNAEIAASSLWALVRAGLFNNIENKGG